MKKLLINILSGIMLFSIIGCAPSNSSTNEEPTEEVPVEVDNTVSVFVLSGQSNMEGSTFYDNGKQWLKKAMNSMNLDPQPCFDGIDNVLTSHYGYYPYESPIKINCSNPDDPMAGKFLPTKVGMGNDKKLMGPELSIAYTLKDHIQEGKKVYFIKCAFSGSGFSSQAPNWKTRNNKDDLYYKLKTYTHNNLKLLEDEGLKPVIKGFLWHQGESDSNSDTQVNSYKTSMKKLLSDFRKEFAPYAQEEDGSNISFIDALIYDGTRLTYGKVDKLNDVKLAIAAENDNNYCINTSTKREGGLKLEIGGDADGGNKDGCYNKYHYCTKDMVMLGQAYANIIIENNLL